MNNDNDKFILNLKTGVIKELYFRQLITQKQMEVAIGLLHERSEQK